MYILSENCVRKEAAHVQNGDGVAKMKVLATSEELYMHGRLFNHITLDPGCSVGYHTHEHETEWYYILKGEAVFNDDGKEVILHAGDLGATGYGQGHSIENRSSEPMEFIALIITE